MDIFIAKSDASSPLFRRQTVGDKSRILCLLVLEPVIGDLTLLIDGCAPRTDLAEIRSEVEPVAFIDIPSEHAFESRRSVSLIILNMSDFLRCIDPASLSHLLPMIQPGIYIVGIYIEPQLIRQRTDIIDIGVVEPFLFRLIRLVVRGSQKFPVPVYLHIIVRRIEQLVVGDGSHIFATDRMILVQLIIHSKAVIV